MLNYSYVALNDKGRKTRGEVMAENELDLETRLKDLGMDLIDYREKKEKKAGFMSKIKMQDMIVFCMHMEQLERAGVPLLDALADARDATDSLKLKNILTSVYENVKNGIMFSTALGQHPMVFDPVFVGLIAAGEKTGNLGESFVNLANHMKWTNDLRRKIKKATRYPIVLVVVLSAVISILMLFVVPKLIEFILAQGFEIPLHTELLISFSSFFGEYWYACLGVPVLTFIAGMMGYRTSESFAYKVDKYMLKAPIIGKVIRKINLARFTQFFSVMFRSGIDILESLRAAREVVGNRVLKESIDLVYRSVIEGNRLTESLRMSSQFPNLVVRMFKVGEESGNMNDALENINFFYNREVDDAVDGMVSMIQPILTVVMGSMIFWVIAAVFGPLYQSFSKMDF
jgi:type IV pilus assembly protein PilC